MKRQSNLIHPLSFISLTFLRRLESALSQAFNIDTCYPDDRKGWTKNIPSYGQCAVAALVVQDHIGGEIVYDQGNNHFWNRVEGVDIDLTRNQFEQNVIIRETRIRSRQELLEGSRADAAETLLRYQILIARVRRLLPNESNKQTLVSSQAIVSNQVNSEQGPVHR